MAQVKDKRVEEAKALLEKALGIKEVKERKGVGGLDLSDFLGTDLEESDDDAAIEQMLSNKGVNVPLKNREGYLEGFRAKVKGQEDIAKTTLSDLFASLDPNNVKSLQAAHANKTDPIKGNVFATGAGPVAPEIIDPTMTAIGTSFGGDTTLTKGLNFPEEEFIKSQVSQQTAPPIQPEFGFNEMTPEQITEFENLIRTVEMSAEEVAGDDDDRYNSELKNLLGDKVPLVLGFLRHREDMSELPEAIKWLKANPNDPNAVGVADKIKQLSFNQGFKQGS